MSKDKHTPEIFEHYDALVRQRDALLAACKEVRATFLGYQKGSIGDQALKKVKAAIALCRETNNERR